MTENKKTAKIEKTSKDAQEEIRKIKSKDTKGREAMPKLKPGMTVCVYQKIKELNIKGEEKERTQHFEGIIIAQKHGQEKGATITVRKISNGVGVEKIFPLNLPSIEKIVIKKQAKVRRAKLYFLKRGHKKRLKEKVVA